MSETITVYEVALRDGLQNEAVLVPTRDKLSLVRDLVQAGLSHVEVTSFVSAKAMPQMADAAAVMREAVAAWPDVRMPALTITDLGYQRAVEAGCKAVAAVVIATESLSQKNSRMDVGASLEVCRRILRRARDHHLWARVYLSAAWVCPYEGPVPPDRVLALCEQIWAEAPSQLVLADSIGHAHPLEVGRLVEEVGRRIGMENVAVHLHDTQALGLANAAAAISAGVRTLDASVGGLGGCPFAPGAAGNLATEDLVLLAHKMGFATGVALEALWTIVAKLEQLLGRPLGGRTGTWWRSGRGRGDSCHADAC